MSSASQTVPAAAKKAKVVVVDDEKVVLRAIAHVLTAAGFEVVTFDDAMEGIAGALDPSVDVALFDIQMPNLTGLDLLRAVKQRRPEVEVLIMTGYATVETAIEAVRMGAYDYLSKPFENIDRVTLVVTKAAERKALVDQNRVLQDLVRSQEPFNGLVGQSEAIRKVFGSEDKCPPIAATKALTGHSQGATGVQEAIYSLLMMNNGFICESAHIEELDPAFADMPIVRKRIDDAKLGQVLSNSFGFGGTNAALVFKRLDA